MTDNSQQIGYVSNNEDPIEKRGKCMEIGDYHGLKPITKEEFMLAWGQLPDANKTDEMFVSVGLCKNGIGNVILYSHNRPDDRFIAPEEVLFNKIPWQVGEDWIQVWQLLNCIIVPGDELNKPQMSAPGYVYLPDIYR